MDKLWKTLSVDLLAAKQAIGMPSFQHNRLLTLALLDTSSLNETELSLAAQSALKTDYRRLAYLGDSLIDAVLAGHLLSACDSLTRAQMDDLRQQIVSREALCQYAIQLGWPDYCTSRNQKNRKPPEEEAGTYGEMFEALVAAIFVEFNRDFSKIYDWLVDSFLKSQVQHFLLPIMLTSNSALPKMPSAPSDSLDNIQQLHPPHSESLAPNPTADRNSPA